MTQVNDFLGRFVSNREIVYKHYIAPNLYLALFRINSNHSNYTIKDYRTADEGEGGTGSQYCGFFNAE